MLAERDGDGLGTGSGTELGEELGHMRFDAFGADVELKGDLRVAEAARDGFEDFALARREVGGRLFLGEKLFDIIGDNGFPRGDFSDCRDKLAVGRALQENAGGSGAKGGLQLFAVASARWVACSPRPSSASSSSRPSTRSSSAFASA